MLLESMDARMKRMKNDHLRNAKNPGSNFGWGLLRVSTTDDEALRRCQANTVNVTVQSYLHRGRRRARPAQSSQTSGKKYIKCKRRSACNGRPAAAFVPPPPGAMAPENTTQYLMSNVYEDMEKSHIQTGATETCAHVYAEYLSPSSVYAALDCGYESCLDFQQKDFEKMFDSC